jgi:cytochrome c556
VGTTCFAALSVVCLFGTGSSVALSSKAFTPSGTTTGDVKLSADWATYVTIDDLTSELSECSTRIAQNLKKPGDFDKFIKSINAEGHLVAILAALVTVHPDAGNWKEIGTNIQAQGLAIAQAAEAKGAKNYRSAQEAHKRIGEMLKKGEKAEVVHKKSSSSNGDSAAPDWTALGDLSHVMKRVDPAYKFIRGKMSNASSFKNYSDQVRHQAAILAVLAEISPAYRADEKEFARFATAMSAAAKQTVAAAKSGDFDKAQDANTAINQACNDCHKAYRLDQGKSSIDF